MRKPVAKVVRGNRIETIKKNAKSPKFNPPPSFRPGAPAPTSEETGGGKKDSPRSRSKRADDSTIQAERSGSTDAHRTARKDHMEAASAHEEQDAHSDRITHHRNMAAMHAKILHDRADEDGGTAKSLAAGIVGAIFAKARYIEKRPKPGGGFRYLYRPQNSKVTDLHHTDDGKSPQGIRRMPDKMVEGMHTAHHAAHNATYDAKDEKSHLTALRSHLIAAMMARQGAVEAERRQMPDQKQAFEALNKHHGGMMARHNDKMKKLEQDRMDRSEPPEG